MTCVHAGVFERHVENPQGALLRNLVLACLRQIVVIFAPLYLGPVVLLHRALDFDLRSVENRGRAADFQADFLHVRVVLDVLRFADGNRGPVVFGRAGLRVANFLIRRLEAGTHRVESADLVILRHRLFAQDRSVLVAISAGL